MSLLRFSIGITLIAAAGICSLWGVDAFLMLPRDFRYEADIISLDNFYDEATKQYLGEELTVTTFSFETIDHADDSTAIVRNIFSVRSPTGTPIFSVQRELGIDRATKKHVPHAGDREREGFLFGPVGSPVDHAYWHVNYDTAAPMTFVGEEKVHGLLTHRYSAEFRADQTANLSHLPKVPDERGVELDVHLETWIEPVTGYLVQYTDNATAWYYDKNTGERLHPWNTFRNAYERHSVRSHVQIAAAIKMQQKTFQWYLPIAVLLLALLFFLPPALRKVGVAIFCVYLLSVVALVFAYISRIPTEDRFTIGIALWEDDEQYQKNLAGLRSVFSRAGLHTLDVSFDIRNANSSPVAQRDNIQYFVEQGVDLLYTLTTPGTLIAQELTHGVPIVFSIVTYPKRTGIVQSLERSGTNAVGTRNWIPAQDQVDIFLSIQPDVKSIGFVRRVDEPNSRVQLQEMKDAAERRNIEIVDMPASDIAEINAMLSEHADAIDAVYGSCDTLVQTGGEDVIVSFVRRRNLPDFTCLESGVEKGSLVGLVANFYELGQLSGEKVLDIFSGIPPTALETTAPQHPLLLINERRAKELNINIPTLLLSRADRVLR